MMEHTLLIAGCVMWSLVMLVGQTHAHGRLIEPPSRSSMWRFGFHTAINYDDNQLFCGGYDVQWHQNGGRCGVCGDPYNGVRENEAGGRYATGAVARRYTEGQTITVTLDITTNHGGYFEFRMCPNNNPSRPVTESCLNQYLLRQPNGHTQWHLPTGTRKFSLNLVLPRGLTCSQCVLQWKWNTASNWDCDASNNCCKGCGPQEHFYGCADVSVTSSTSGSHIHPVRPAVNVNPGHPVVDVNAHHGIPVINAIAGGAQQGGVASGGSGNTNTCEAVPAWKLHYIFADSWCRTQCAVGNCPTQYCQDGCRLLHV